MLVHACQWPAVMLSLGKHMLALVAFLLLLVRHLLLVANIAPSSKARSTC